MIEKEYPTLNDVRQMKVEHGKLIAADRHSSSHGMMAFSGVSDRLTLKEVNGEFVVLQTHKTDMDGTTEKLYRADAAALSRISEIAERENLYAWGEMRIDPEKDSRPKMFDYSSSAGISLYTDDAYGDIFSFSCDTARFYGAGDVIDEIYDIIGGFVRDENFISEKVTPVTDPNVIEMKKNFFKMPMSVDPSKQTPLSADLGEWKCPECNAEGNTGKFCTNCGALRPAPEEEKAAAQDEAEQEWVYDGGDWKCPKCNGEGNEGKFCLTCGSWRPDLDPNKNKTPEPKSEREPQTQPAFPMMNGMLKAMGLLPVQQADEQLRGLLEKGVSHGRLLSFEFSGWSNGMSMNSHQENSTRLTLSENGEAVVANRSQQGSSDAMVTEYEPNPQVIAELEKFIRERNLTNLTELKYDRSKDPFAGMTDTSGGSHYSIVFDDSSVGGNKFAAFLIDLAAISQHGGGEVLDQLRGFKDRLSTEGRIVKFYTEPKSAATNSFMGMGMLGMMGMTQPAADKWTCSECGYDQNGGKFCNNCGSPRK